MGIEWTLNSEWLLFLAVALSGHAKTVKTTLQEQAIIYVMKTDVFCFFVNFKMIKKKMEGGDDFGTYTFSFTLN